MVGLGDRRNYSNMRHGKQNRRAIAFKEKEEHGGGALSTMKAKSSRCATSQRTMTSGWQAKMEAHPSESRIDS